MAARLGQRALTIINPAVSARRSVALVHERFGAGMALGLAFAYGFSPLPLPLCGLPGCANPRV